MPPTYHTGHGTSDNALNAITGHLWGNTSREDEHNDTLSAAERGELNNNSDGLDARSPLTQPEEEYTKITTKSPLGKTLYVTNGETKKTPLPPTQRWLESIETGETTTSTFDDDEMDDDCDCYTCAYCGQENFIDPNMDIE